VRVTLKFELPAKKGQQELPDEIDAPKNASHIVIGVTEGFEAFFVFEKEFETNVSAKQMKTKLETLLSKLSRKPNDDSIFVKDFSNDVTCTVIGDFDENFKSCNFKEAVDLLRGLLKDPPEYVTKIAHMKKLKNNRIYKVNVNNKQLITLNIFYFENFSILKL